MVNTKLDCMDNPISRFDSRLMWKNGVPFLLVVSQTNFIAVTDQDNKEHNIRGKVPCHSCKVNPCGLRNECWAKKLCASCYMITCGNKNGWELINSKSFAQMFKDDARCVICNKVQFEAFLPNGNRTCEVCGVLEAGNW